MTDVIKTSPVTAPPSIALAMMAWKLAQFRTLGMFGLLHRPVRREVVDEDTRASAEHYHILRRIEDGEAP